MLRQRFLLYFPSAAGITYQTISDSGVGSDVIAAAVTIAISDSGAGADSLPAVEADVTVTDTGAGSETIASKAQAQVSDSGVGTDVLAVPEAQATISDNGVGTELLLPPEARSTIADSGAGTEIVVHGPILSISDTALGIDIVYRVQGEISLDGIALPHVLNISVEEPSIVQDLPIMDALPYRKQRGKKGRSLKIQGWTDSLSTLEILRGYADGEKHFLLLPTGDSMYVLVSGVRTPETVENYDRYDYEMDVAEAVD